MTLQARGAGGKIAGVGNSIEHFQREAVATDVRRRRKYALPKLRQQPARVVNAYWLQGHIGGVMMHWPLRRVPWHRQQIRAHVEQLRYLRDRTRAAWAAAVKKSIARHHRRREARR